MKSAFLQSRFALLSLAVRFGTTRLIDNEPLGDPPAAA